MKLMIEMNEWKWCECVSAMSRISDSVGARQRHRIMVVIFRRRQDFQLVSN